MVSDVLLKMDFPTLFLNGPSTVKLDPVLPTLSPFTLLLQCKELVS